MDLNAPNLVPTKQKSKRMSNKSKSSKKVKAAPVKLPVQPIYTEGKTLTVTGYAGGSSRTKKVSVIAFVPAGQNIFTAFANKFGFNVPNGVKNMEIRFGRAVSKAARYIVRENRASDSNPRSKIASFYSPNVSAVEKQNSKSGAHKKTTASAPASTPTTPVTIAQTSASPFFRGY